MATNKTEFSDNGRPDIDPHTGLAYEWVHGTMTAVEDAINRKANALRQTNESPGTSHATLALCLYKNFLMAMRRAQYEKQFTDACALWALRLERPLADVLMERGLITGEDRREIERKIERKIKKHGNVRASLAAVAGADARDLIRSIDQPEIRNSLSSLPPAVGHVLLETVIPPHEPESSRYTLTRMHAEGGLGRVWLARDRDLHRGVALKEIRPDRAANPSLTRS